MDNDVVKNICWGLLGGWILFVYLAAIGVLYGITIIGAKKAYMCFKFAVFSLAPYGKNVLTNYGSHKFGNTFWLITTGWQISIVCVVISALWYLTYYGRYLSSRWFHLAQFVVAPFGSVIKNTSLLNPTQTLVAQVTDNYFDISK